MNLDTPELKKILEFLQSKGYSSEWTPDIVDYKAYVYKRIPGTKSHQFVVTVFDFSQFRLPAKYALELGVTFEAANGWVTAKFYSLTFQELQERLSYAEANLAAAIVPLGGDSEYYKIRD